MAGRKEKLGRGFGQRADLCDRLWFEFERGLQPIEGKLKPFLLLPCHYYLAAGDRLRAVCCQLIQACMHLSSVCALERQRHLAMQWRSAAETK